MSGNREVRVREGRQGWLGERRNGGSAEPAGYRGFLLALPALALAMAVSPAAAQVNTETIWEEEVDGFVGAASLDLVIKSGNTDLSLIGTTLRLEYAPTPAGEGSEEGGPAPEGPGEPGPEEPGPEEPEEAGPRDIYRMFASFERGESGGSRIASNGFAYVSWVRMLHTRFGWGLLAQHQFDEFTLLDQRTLLGVAVRAVRDPAPWLQMQLGTGYMYEYEELDVPADGPDEPESSSHRWLNFLVLGASFDEGRVRVINTLYLQPRFDELDDFRVLDEAELSVRLTERVALALSGTLRHDSRPPAGVESTDIGLVNRLRVTF